MDASINVLGSPLAACSHHPVTGWFRDGCCNTDPTDRGSHTVCAMVTDDFLACLADMGNDLRTPSPHFPGLSEGDCWCVCAASWFAAYQQGRACPVYLESTHGKALSAVPLEALLEHAVAVEA